MFMSHNTALKICTGFHLFQEYFASLDVHRVTMALNCHFSVLALRVSDMIMEGYTLSCFFKSKWFLYYFVDKRQSLLEKQTEGNMMTEIHTILPLCIQNCNLAKENMIYTNQKPFAQQIVRSSGERVNLLKWKTKHACTYTHTSASNVDWVSWTQNVWDQKCLRF